MAERRRPAPPRGASGLAERTEGYRPQVIDWKTWQKVGPFVLDCASRLPMAGWPSASRTLRTLTRLSAWTLEEGMDLDVEGVLDPDTVERFVTQGLKNKPGQATYRSVLRRIGPLLTARAPWEPRQAALARRQVAPPYSERELSLLRSDSVQQSTETKRRAARALLAFGAGAGLDGRWVTRVSANDVTSQSSGVVVRVGDPKPRVVPVLRQWESEVASLVETVGDQFLVGGYSRSPNRASNLAAGLRVPVGHPPLSAARLRSTWLLWHLQAGTRLPELVAAAGLEGATVLSDLLPLVAPLTPNAAREALRGSSR